MTTIVYDHKAKKIAVDGRLSSGNVIVSDDAIKYKHSGDCIWFFTGSFSDFDDLLDMKHNEKPDVKPDASAICVVDGVAWLVNFNGDYCSHTKLEHNYAIGSGSKFALSAFDFGCDAEGAVSYAAKRDVFTGGKVIVLDINTMLFI